MPGVRPMGLLGFGLVSFGDGRVATAAPVFARLLARGIDSFITGASRLRVGCSVEGAGRVGRDPPESGVSCRPDSGGSLWPLTVRVRCC